MAGYLLSMTADLVVVGAGSGGFGAALAAARRGCSVLVVEKSRAIGGNANRCGVNNWEPVCGATGFPHEIYRRLERIPCAVGIYGFGRHCVWQGIDAYPGGEHVLFPERSYRDTMVRHGARSLADDEDFVRENLSGVVFEPRAYEAVLWQMLGETGRCRVMLGRTVESVGVDDGRLRSVTLDDGTEIRADAFVDGTGDGNLARLAGCELVSGQESRDAYGEPSAPTEPNDRVNAVTLMFRITAKPEPGIDALPDDVATVARRAAGDVACDWAARFPLVVTVEYPNGDRNVNMLPTMDGREYLDRTREPGGHERAYAECRRRLYATWRHLQTKWPEFRSFTIHSISPEIGVRESYRLVAERVLTEHDILRPIPEDDEEGVIAIADHALDRHGEKGGAMELKHPFGVPYHCLLPRGYTNLLVACRAAGFSSIAASSCRLSRTMMQLGQAAGTSFALAREAGRDPAAVDLAALRQALRADGVQLSWASRRARLRRARGKGITTEAGRSRPRRSR